MLGKIVTSVITNLPQNALGFMIDGNNYMTLVSHAIMMTMKCLHPAAGSQEQVGFSHSDVGLVQTIWSF